MDARKIVPCFDEPEYKAIWNVTVIHPVGTKAIANAEELDETTSQVRCTVVAGLFFGVTQFCCLRARAL
ncbi:hypothetical protein ANCCAN_06512 [Ancylostoma caninum]|uniref:Aminopeptidase N-like N-terminal domain-containing protein n=1 Tax=Ancylostoma caninum TaxID=29170 RepID=A0A368GSY5_ANCCA|nr:hypothetical protein ANCCAN_06512 [Ancylostoma caninum]